MSPSRFDIEERGEGEHRMQSVLQRAREMVTPEVGYRESTLTTLVFGKCPLCEWHGRGRDVNHMHTNTRSVAYEDSVAHIQKKHPEAGLQ